VVRGPGSGERLHLGCVLGHLGCVLGAGAGWRRMRLTSANGQPAVAMYLLDEDGAFYGRPVPVLSITAGGLSRIVAFDWPGVLAGFGLPEVLPATEGP
jgi:RNA polymerase sigma-70 factor (ECF subfamily)